MHQVLEQDIGRDGPEAHGDAAYQRAGMEVLVDAVGQYHGRQPDDGGYPVFTFGFLLHDAFISFLLKHVFRYSPKHGGHQQSGGKECRPFYEGGVSLFAVTIATDGIL